MTEFKKFERNVVLINLMLATSITSGLVCIPHIIKGNIGLAALWLVVALIWFANFIWSKSTPSIEITNNDIALYLALLRKPMIIQWTDVQETKLLSINKVALILKSGKKVKIDLFCVNKNKRDALIETLRQGKKL